MIQFSRFSDGCFVLHKIEIGRNKYSAWFGKDGTLFSAELVLQNGNTRDIGERQTEVRRQLQAIGNRYKEN